MMNNNKNSRSFKLQPKAIATPSYSSLSTFVPELRISGKWLAEQGFQIGAMIEVIISKKKLIIKPKEAPLIH